MNLRTEKVYDALTTAFEELLTEKSFDQITVTELCQRARTRRATFYNHFADKYAFFQFMMRRLRDQLFAEANLPKVPAATPESLNALVDVILSFAEQHRQLALSIKNSPLAEQMQFSLTSESLGEYEHRLALDDRLTVHFLLGGINQCGCWWLSNPNAVTPEEMRQRLYALVDRLVDQERAEK